MADMQDKPAEADLTRAARAGDRNARAALVDRHLTSVYALAFRMLRNTADAEDVTQEVFLRAFEQLNLFDERHSLRAWLLKITTNLALNHLRTRQRQRAHLLRSAKSKATVMKSEQSATDLPDQRQWQHWLGELNEPHRTAIVLFHFCEMPYAQVGEVLNVPVNTVKTYLHRGRRRLRELMITDPAWENRSWNVAIQNG